MAKDAVDEAVHGLDARPAVPRVVHRGGAAARRRRATAALWNQRHLLAAAGRPARRRGSSTCCDRYGSLVARGARPDRRATRLAEPLPGAEDYLRAEIVYAATHEGARHLDDVLTRRTRISIETFDRGAALRRGGRRADGRRCWAGRRAGAARSSTTGSGSQAERESQQKPDDQTADAARLGAADVVPAQLSRQPDPTLAGRPTMQTDRARADLRRSPW